MKNLEKRLRKYIKGGISLEKAVEDLKYIDHLSDAEIGMAEAMYPLIQAKLAEETKNEGSSSNVLEELQESIDRDVEYGRKERFVKEKKIDNDFEKYRDADQKEQLLKELKFTDVSPESVEALIEQNQKAFESYLCAKGFVAAPFNGIVPFTQGEAILVLAETGASKTTLSANIIWSTVKQKNPETGAYGRVLVISNEENERDMFNRVACLAKIDSPSELNPEAWHYVNRGKFKPDQIEYFNAFIKDFKSAGLINFIGLDYIPGELEFTCYLENIKAVLNQVIAAPGSYDCVIIDYYQNIQHSLKRPADNMYMVQAVFAASLNSFKEKLDCPIVIMAQIKKDDEIKSWSERIVGTKSIAQPCSFAMEAIPDKTAFTTDWIFHKARYADSSTRKLTTGFKYGLIVAKDEKFDAWVKPIVAAKNQMANAEKESEMERELGTRTPKKRRQGN